MNRFNRIKSIFLKDINWKIFSVAIAVVLWIIVINIENPIETRKYSVPLSIRNEQHITEQGYYLTNLNEIANTPITLSVRGERSSLDTLTKLRESISVYVNLTKSTIDVSSGTVIGYVETTLPIYSGDSLEIVSQSVGNVVFYIEANEYKEMPIDIIALDEEGADNYILPELSVNPSFATVSGPKSAVDSIDKLCVYFDNIEVDANVNKKIHAYNAEGIAVENVYLSSKEAVIVVPEKEKAEIEFRVKTSGDPENGYMVSGINVDLSGKEFFSYGGALKNAFVNLPDIDVTGKKESFKTVFNVLEYLPNEASLSEESNTDLEVTVNISKKESKRFFINTSDINVQGLEEGFEIAFHGDLIEVIIEGTLDEIEALKKEDIKLNVSVDNCVAGNFVTYAEALIPESSTLNGGARIEYRIVEK